MRIAVLAWGSLVWQPRNDHGELSMAGGWQTDCPELPIEFARISSDGRLTLIITPGYPHSSRVLWAVSGLDDLDAAAANLTARETNAPLDRIHGIGAHRTLGSPDSDPAPGGMPVDGILSGQSTISHPCRAPPARSPSSTCGERHIRSTPR